jgi:uncharacterized lipoprotein YbaY
VKWIPIADGFANDLNRLNKVLSMNGVSDFSLRQDGLRQDGLRQDGSLQFRRMDLPACFMFEWFVVFFFLALSAPTAVSAQDATRNWTWNNLPSITADPTGDRTLTRPQSPGWTFGARGVSTRTGVLLRDIVSNSPATRAGLRAGDYVVTVGGSQVGLVGGRLYDLEEEINNRADNNGTVSILVFNSTSARLEPIEIQLSPRQTGVSGTIVGLDRFRLPSDSTINVQIINLSRPHFGVRNGTVSLRPSINASSLPFSIAYDPSYIYSEDQYAVRAHLTSGGNVLYVSDRNPRVLTQGNPAEVQVRMVAADTSLPTTGNPGQGTHTNTEAISRQIQAIYQRYLRRDPYYIEQSALMLDPRIQERLKTLPLELMATQEFFDATGNNEAAWITQIFKEMTGRNPQASELQNWQRRFAELRYSRSTLLAQLQSQIPR